MDTTTAIARFDEVRADTERASYRNFFPPGARWPVTGLRLADDGRRA